jgi:alpha-N-acetylglucosaminidase
VIIAWSGNPSPALLDGVRNKSRLLLLATEADKYATWDSASRWPGVPYAFGSIYNFGGGANLGANATTIVERWFADLTGPNAARLRGVAIFPESWTANPVAAELLSELPWRPTRPDLEAWLSDYAVARHGAGDAHARNAWSILADTAYATPPDGNSAGHDSLFDA